MIGALLAGASVVSGLLGSSSAKKAAKVQAQSQQAAIDEQRRQFDATRADYEPFRQVGLNALATLQDPNAFKASPGYAWQQQQGTANIMGNRAAAGTAKSGNALKALTEFSSNLAAQDYGNWWNRQAGLAGVGQQATNAVGQFGAQSSANIGNLLQGQGEARASGVMGAANSLSGALNSGLNNFLLFKGGAFGNSGGQTNGLFGWNYPNGGFGGGIGRNA